MTEWWLCAEGTYLTKAFWCPYDPCWWRSKFLPQAWPIGWDPAHKHRLRIPGSSMVVWVVFWVGGDSGSPHKSSYTQFYPVLRKSQTKLLISRSAETEWSYLRITPPFSCTSLFLFQTTNKERLIAGVEKPMVWPHQSRSSWGGGESPSSSVCLKIKRPFQSTWGPAMQPWTILMHVRKYLLCWAMWGRTWSLGLDHFGLRFPKAFNSKMLFLKCFVLVSHTPCLKFKKKKKIQSLLYF